MEKSIIKHYKVCVVKHYIITAADRVFRYEMKLYLFNRLIHVSQEIR